MSEKISKQNEKYQAQANKHRKFSEFKEGDLVQVHLRKERFPRGQFAKLKPRADGPFKVLKRIGENAYKIELPAEYEVSETLKVSDLFPYYGEESTNDQGASLLQLDGENQK